MDELTPPLRNKQLSDRLATFGPEAPPHETLEELIGVERALIRAQSLEEWIRDRTGVRLRAYRKALYSRLQMQIDNEARRLEDAIPRLGEGVDGKSVLEPYD